jgi:hypothetical protein
MPPPLRDAEKKVIPSTFGEMVSVLYTFSIGAKHLTVCGNGLVPPLLLPPPLLEVLVPPLLLPPPLLEVLVPPLLLPPLDAPPLDAPPLDVVPLLPDVVPLEPLGISTVLPPQAAAARALMRMEESVGPSEVFMNSRLSVD